VDDVTSKAAVILIIAGSELGKVIRMPTVAERTAPSRAGWFAAGSLEPARSPGVPELLSRRGVEVYELEAATGFPQSTFWMIWMSSSVRYPCWRA
jgi:hypothetical protein